MHRRTTLRALLVALLTALLMAPAAPGWSDHKDDHEHSHDDPAPAPAPSPTGCTPPAGSFHVGTHNVLHGTATFTPFATAIGWQEVTRAVHRTKMKNQLGTAYRHYIPANSSAAAVPVSWRAGYFSFLAARSVKTHDGRLGVTPSRWITIVHLRKRTTGQRVIVVNTHFISEAFKEGSSYRAWRLNRWYTHLWVLRRELNRIRYNNPRAALFLVGDFNRRGYLDFSAQQISPLRAGTSTPIDHLYAGVPGRGGCVAKLTTMGSDHNRWRASAWIA